MTHCELFGNHPSTSLRLWRRLVPLPRWGRILCLCLVMTSCGAPPAPVRQTTPAVPWPDLAERGDERIWAQLRQYATRPEVCAAALSRQRGWKITRLADTAPSPGCGLRGAVRIEAAPVSINRSLDISCPMAASLHLWLRDAVQPAARLYLNQQVSGIESFGTYACRTRNNVKGAPLSEHATANAIDISALVLSDGRRLRIADLGKMKEEERDFIQSVRKSACRTASVVLGPGSDGYHEDHIHIDMGRWRACR